VPAPDSSACTARGCTLVSGVLLACPQLWGWSCHLLWVRGTALLWVLSTNEPQYLSCKCCVAGVECQIKEPVSLPESPAGRLSGRSGAAEEEGMLPAGLVPGWQQACHCSRLFPRNPSIIIFSLCLQQGLGSAALRYAFWLGRFLPPSLSLSAACPCSPGRGPTTHKVCCGAERFAEIGTICVPWSGRHTQGGQPNPCVCSPDPWTTVSGEL